MRPYDVIKKKRDGFELSEKEIRFMVQGYVDGKVPDYQMAALLMTIFFRHMTPEERFQLTKCMAESGNIVTMEDFQGKRVDKHSSGGVADTTSLVVCPMVAACGMNVVKMSGRGLGHTGGTIDKLESIPGFRTALSKEEVLKAVNESGIVIVGQTGNLAPADKKLYALRDVTATIDEVSLIASSIMSKKIASGAEGIVLDVKTGNGAFMKEEVDAVILAEAMVDIGKRYGRETVALVTDMNQPLGMRVGNSLEALEAIQTLRGERKGRLLTLSVELGATMLQIGGIVKEIDEGKQMLEDSITTGKALEKFKAMVEVQGGKSDVVDKPEEVLPFARYTEDVVAEEDGWVEGIDTESVGRASMMIGAGREKKEDKIDLSVGLELFKSIGDEVKKGERTARIYYNDNDKLSEAKEMLFNAFKIRKKRTIPPKLVKHIIK